jgi:hypothetical protein
MCLSFFGWLGGFLLSAGRDVSSQLPAMHTAVHPLALRLLRTTRDARLRDAVLRYLRALCALGTLAGTPALGDASDWVARELSQPGFRW